MFRTFIIAVLAFIVGSIISYLAVVIGVTSVWDFMGVHDQDGGGAMTLGLVVAPACAVIGGVVFAVLVSMWMAKRRGHTGPQTAEKKRQDIRRFSVVGGALVGGYIGHQVSEYIFWYVSPISLDSRWKVLAITWMPTLIMALSAIAGGLIVHRLSRSSKNDVSKTNGI